MNNYTQLSQEERAIIADLWRRGKSYYYIAKWLKRKYDTIKNEVERNGEINKFDNIVYSSKKAQKVYLERRRESKEKSRIIENNFEIEEKIINLITEKQLSPDQISSRYKTVCHQTIYNWIYRMFDYKNRKTEVSPL